MHTCDMAGPKERRHVSHSPSHTAVGLFVRPASTSIGSFGSRVRHSRLLVARGLELSRAD